MNSPRDHIAALRWRAANGRVHASNAWYRAVGRRIQGARGQLANTRAARAHQRGRRDLPRRTADTLRSSLPVVRNRIDPATGHPNRDSRHLGRTTDASLARMKATRERDPQWWPPAAWERTQQAHSLPRQGRAR